MTEASVLAKLDPARRAQLQTLLDQLATSHVSLSSVTDPKEAWNVHVADSLSGLEIQSVRQARRLADIGAGAGFPGLVLAVMLPQARVDLIESVGRKCEFMREAAEAAAIDNASVVAERSETWAAGAGAEAYDVVTARAVGRLALLVELASPLLRTGGTLVAWKGAPDPDEEAEAGKAAPLAAMRLRECRPVQPFAASRNRHLYVYEKTGPTPPNLPRRPGVARKRPLG